MWDQAFSGEIECATLGRYQACEFTRVRTNTAHKYNYTQTNNSIPVDSQDLLR